MAKALGEGQGARYPSAEALASDIRRYLKDEPIAARPPSSWYQLSKFSRRNKVLVGGVVASFVILAGGIIATGLALQRALRAETGLKFQLQETERARNDEADQRRRGRPRRRSEEEEAEAVKQTSIAEANAAEAERCAIGCP